MAWVGTSGWSYDHWDGVLYEPGTASRRRLERYAAEFATVELNASFYRWPRDTSFASWRRRLPPGFRLSVKAPRGLTHGRRLHQPEVWVDRLARSWHELGERRALMLVQLPPTMARDDARLDWFLDRLPWWLPVAVELRHPTWLDDAVFDLLHRHGATYCVMSGAGLPCVLRATARPVYLRLHGPDHDHLYAGSYSEADLHWWAERIREWERAGHEVYAYFNNDGHGHAVRNARTLRGLLAG
ncbi:MAG: DUF72 domain-containing protein [Nocardioidaceae bacterium]